MSRSVTRIQNFTRVTELAADDVLVVGPASGDRAKGITKENLEKQFEGDGANQVITEVSANYTALITDDWVVVFGGTEFELPDFSSASKQIGFVNASGSDVDINNAPNTTVLSNTQSREFLPTTSGWLEVS